MCALLRLPLPLPQHIQLGSTAHQQNFITILMRTFARGLQRPPPLQQLRQQLLLPLLLALILRGNTVHRLRPITTQRASIVQQLLLQQRQ